MDVPTLIPTHVGSQRTERIPERSEALLTWRSNREQEPSCGPSYILIMRVCFWDVTLRMAMNRTSASYSLRLLLFRGHRLRETGRLETSSFASPYVHRAPSRMCGRVVRGYNDHVFLLYALFRLAFISRRPNSPEICFAL